MMNQRNQTPPAARPSTPEQKTTSQTARLVSGAEGFEAQARLLTLGGSNETQKTKDLESDSPRSNAPAVGATARDASATTTTRDAATSKSAEPRDGASGADAKDGAEVKSADEKKRAPEVRFMNFEGAGEKAASYPGRFERGMDVAATEKVLGEIRREGEKREVGAVFAPDGQLRLVSMGTAATEGASASVDIMGMMSKSGVNPGESIVTHSHPEGRPLSESDLIVMAERGIGQMRAVGFCTYAMVGKAVGELDDTAAVGPAERVRQAYSIKGGANALAHINEKYGGPKVSLTKPGKGPKTVNFEGSDAPWARAIAEFAGCQAVASEMGWQFSADPARSLEDFVKLAVPKLADGAKLTKIERTLDADDVKRPRAAGAASKGGKKTTRDF